jgi:HPt (histidine-containing phosphotransfer) domain-containing protein
MANNAVLYTSMLRKFVTSQEQVMNLVASHLADGDAATAERLAHTLRGVAGNLGATDLQLRAQEVETCIRTGTSEDVLAELHRQCADTLDRLVAELRAVPGLMPQEPAPENRELSAEQRLSGTQVLQQIRQMLDDGDAEAKELWVAHAQVLHVLCANATQVEAAIDDFDFEAALQLL